MPKTGPNLTDMGNGQRFARLHKDNVRFCWPWKKWPAWDGQRWNLDAEGTVHRLAKQSVQSIYKEAACARDEGQRKALAQHALKTEEAGRLRAMIDLARSEPGIPVLPKDLDTDPWLLNCPNGTLDLRTGELREHRQADLITKLCPVEYDPDAIAPTW